MNILFSLCWLGEDWRIDRNIKWLAYHKKLKQQLGYDKIIFVDNASSLENLRLLGGVLFDDKGNLLCDGDKDLEIYRYNEHLSRTGVWEYPYCWRGLKWLQDYIKNNNITKIIFLDTDFFILSGKLANYVKNLDSGWVSFYCKRHNFPEAAFHICCKDSLSKLFSIDIPSYTHYNNQHMEYILPFTHVNKIEFVGDRYGEFGKKQEPDMDYYGQWYPSLEELKFYG